MTRQIIHLAYFALAAGMFVFGIYEVADTIETGAPIALTLWATLFAVGGAIATIALAINPPVNR